MSDFFSIIKDLNTTAKEVLMLIAMQASFWVIPFMLFKPKFFEFPFYAQFALIFALTIMWLFATLFSSMHIINNYINPDANPIRICSIVAIVLLNISILVGYYFSTSFTLFLQISYGIMLLYFISVFIYFVIKEVKNDNSDS